MSFGDITISEQEKNMYFRVLHKLKEKRKSHKPLEHSDYFKFNVCLCWGPGRYHILKMEYKIENQNWYSMDFYTMVIEYDLLQNKEKYLLVFDCDPNSCGKEIKDLKTVKDLLFSSYKEIDAFYQK